MADANSAWSRPDEQANNLGADCCRWSHPRFGEAHVRLSDLRFADSVIQID